jgi:hypothetical protein
MGELVIGGYDHIGAAIQQDVSCGPSARLPRRRGWYSKPMRDTTVRDGHGFAEEPGWLVAVLRPAFSPIVDG